jgi:hypothetical protein
MRLQYLLRNIIDSEYLNACEWLTCAFTTHPLPVFFLIDKAAFSASAAE